MSDAPHSSSPIPSPRDDDDDDVAWALQTAQVQWKRGGRAEALTWLRRAAESAIEAEAWMRAQEINNSAAAFERDHVQPGPSVSSAPPAHGPVPSFAPAPIGHAQPQIPTSTNSLPSLPLPPPPPPPRKATPSVPVSRRPTESPWSQNREDSETRSEPLPRFASSYPAQVELKAPAPARLPRFRSSLPAAAAGLPTPPTVEFEEVEVLEEVDELDVTDLSDSEFDNAYRASSPEIDVGELSLDAVDEELLHDLADMPEERELPSSRRISYSSKPPPPSRAASAPPPSSPSSLPPDDFLEPFQNDGGVAPLDYDEDEDEPTSPSAHLPSLAQLRRSEAPLSTRGGPPSTLSQPPSMVPDSAGRRRSRVIRPPTLPPELPSTTRRRFTSRPPGVESPSGVPTASSGAPASERPSVRVAKAVPVEARRSVAPGRSVLSRGPGPTGQSPLLEDAPARERRFSSKRPSTPSRSVRGGSASVPPSSRARSERGGSASVPPSSRAPSERGGSASVPPMSQGDERRRRRFASTRPQTLNSSLPPPEEFYSSDSRRTSSLLPSPANEEPFRGDSASVTAPEEVFPISSAAPDAAPKISQAPENVGPPTIEGVSLMDVRGLQDLPEDALSLLVQSARVEELASEEELSFFAVAMVLSGGVHIMPAIADASCSYASRGEVVFTSGTLPDGIELRVSAGEDGTRVAVWERAALDQATSGCPWVADDLRLIADSFQALAGVAVGELGERLDDSLRAMVTERCEVRTLLPFEIIVEQGKPMSGMHIVGGGRLELVTTDGGQEILEATLGPGEFLFGPEILAATPAPCTARAGKDGALVLFADRHTAHELMVSVPPLLEIFAR